MSRIQQHLENRYDQDVSDLIEILRIPSISALSEYREEMARAAEWLKEYMVQLRLENACVLPTSGHPIVYADWLNDPAKPTALIYGHYDVQPVDPLHLWQTPPFEPDVRAGRLYARGASDDKGQVMAHLAALGALLDAEGSLPVNVRILIEGEEEIGSPSLEPFIKAHPERVKADFIVISDTSMFARGLPTLCTSLRGIAGLELHVTTATSDLHSGLFGGAAPNALQVLAELIAATKDPNGRVTVPGFYDRVIQPTPQEREAFAALPFDEAGTLESLNLAAWAGEGGYSPLERMTIRPTFEVNGMWGGFQGEGTKTVIPNEAHAKITCRLVPAQEPEEIIALLTRHFEALAPPYASVKVDVGHGARPWKAEIDHPVTQAAITALQRTFGQEVALAPSGGSIPVVESFDRLLGLPCVLMGFADPDCNAHAPDEFFSLESFRLAREAICEFWREVADGHRR